MNINDTQLQNRIYVQHSSKIRLLKIALEHVKDVAVFKLMLRGLGLYFKETVHIIKVDKLYILDTAKNEACFKYTYWMGEDEYKVFYARSTKHMKNVLKRGLAAEAFQYNLNTHKQFEEVEFEVIL